MSSHQVLFCPFCGESFEGRSSCPAHELPLVPFDRAPAFADGGDDDDVAAGVARDAADDAGALSPWEPRFGRALVALGAVLLAVSPLLGLARVGGEVLRTHEVARRFPSLWTWPLVSFCALYLLSRRRTRASLRGVRVVVPWLGLVALLTLVLAGVRLGGAIFEAPAGYVVVVASALLVAAGARLGVARQ